MAFNSCRPWLKCRLQYLQIEADAKEISYPVLGIPHLSRNRKFDCCTTLLLNIYVPFSEENEAELGLLLSDVAAKYRCVQSSSYTGTSPLTFSVVPVKQEILDGAHYEYLLVNLTLPVPVRYIYIFLDCHIRDLLEKNTPQLWYDEVPLPSYVYINLINFVKQLQAWLDSFHDFYFLRDPQTLEGLEADLSVMYNREGIVRACKEGFDNQYASQPFSPQISPPFLLDEKKQVYRKWPVGLYRVRHLLDTIYPFRFSGLLAFDIGFGFGEPLEAYMWQNTMGLAKLHPFVLAVGVVPPSVVPPFPIAYIPIYYECPDSIDELLIQFKGDALKINSRVDKTYAFYLQTTSVEDTKDALASRLEFKSVLMRLTAEARVQVLRHTTLDLTDDFIPAIHTFTRYEETRPTHTYEDPENYDYCVPGVRLRQFYYTLDGKPRRLEDKYKKPVYREERAIKFDKKDFESW